MKPIIITFEKGIQSPPMLGTLKLKPTSDGKASYAQNIDVSNDEYGNSAVVPGPALTTIGNNSQLSGIPTFRQFFGRGVLSPEGTLYFAQGGLGTKTIIRRITNIISGSTPSIDTGWSVTIVDHGTGHANQEVTDMIGRDNSGHLEIYITGKDDSDTWVYKIDTNDASPTLSLVTATGTFTSGLTSPILVLGDDNYIYWIRKDTVYSIDTSDAVIANKLALGLPKGAFATAGIDSQQTLIVATNNEQFGDFSRRQSGGRASVSIWDRFSPSVQKTVPAPCRYISVIVSASDGSLLVFGGVDEGKSSIYSFNGYGFNLITQYIGDLPRSRHSVEFDGQGRICFQTADGQLCRYDRATDKFEHLGSITTGSSSGGLLAKGIGSPTGNEFFVASGSGSTYTLKKVQFGSYIGDGGGADTINTPLIASGIQILPPKSNIQWATLNLTKPLESGERVELRIYKNGSTTDYVTYLTMDYSIDGAISSKREDITLDNINSFNAIPVYKMADGNPTAPPILSVEVMPGITQD